MQDFSLIESRLGVQFKKKDLLQEALTHRSYLNEHAGYGGNHNERLEFLGDAVLELVVTEYLFAQFPSYPEGQMTSLRAALVNAESLASVATSIGLNDFVRLSRGEAKDVGRARQYILANTFEAVVGAVYLDQGYQVAQEFIQRHLLGTLQEILDQELWRDPKSLFQEESQGRLGITPTYQVLDQWGPDHEKHFLVGVFLGDELVAEGEGPSKQAAQVKAAEAALDKKGWENA